MASNITAQVAGGEAKSGLEADTVGELAEQVGASNHSAVVNGEPANESTSLEDYNFVTFAPKVKAGA